MLIMNQKRNFIVNLDNARTIETSFTNPAQMDIDVWFTDGKFETIGSYKTKERALEVLQKIAEIQGGTSTYYMPEE